MCRYESLLEKFPVPSHNFNLNEFSLNANFGRVLMRFLLVLCILIKIHILETVSLRNLKTRQILMLRTLADNFIVNGKNEGKIN